MDTIGETKLIEAMHSAVCDNDANRVRALLESHQKLLFHPSAQGFIWLHNAITDRNEAMVRLLLEHGADPNKPTATGYVPLHMSMEPAESVGLARLLLEHGADPDLRGPSSATMLHAAIHSVDSEGFTRLLLAHGAQPNVLDQFGAAPIAVAARYGHDGAAKLLLTHGADPYLKGQSQNGRRIRDALNAFEEAETMGRHELLSCLQAWVQVQRAAVLIDNIATGKSLPKGL